MGTVVCWHCWRMKTITLLLCMSSLATCDFVGHHEESRSGRQEDGIQGGVDFSGCTTDQETGLGCVEKEETVTSIEKDPILVYTQGYRAVSLYLRNSVQTFSGRSL